ncbi:MAG: hypothetical protein KIT45_00645 [Fimbriimonadia bacterium]|nr:hypothetical protein [Fimbriimonadia bacterium]
MKRCLGTPNPAHLGCESHPLETSCFDFFPSSCKDHFASKEYRCGCSIDCGGTPMRVYERTMDSQGSWTSVEDYLQAGNAL